MTTDGTAVKMSETAFPSDQARYLHAVKRPGHEAFAAQAWLARHVDRAECEAFAAIEQFAQTPSHVGLLRTILSSALDRGVGGGDCTIALRLPLLIHSCIHDEPDDAIYQLAGALVLLEAGIYTFDHIMDREVDGPLAELPQGAVLLGAASLLSHLPNQVVLALPRDATVTAQLARILADGLAKIGAGQLEDIASADLRTPSSKAVEFAVTMKTGERRALLTTMAATLAGASSAQVRAYADFGRALGIARQLRTDLVDLFGAAPSRDLASRVLTLPLALYLEREDREHSMEMATLLSSAGQQQGIQRQVCDRLRDSGIMREVAGMVEFRCRQALDQLDLAQPLRRAGLLLRDLTLATSLVASR